MNVLLAEVLGEEQNGIEAAKAILMALRSKAIKGDVRAAEVLLNRAYGASKVDVQINNVIERIQVVQLPDNGRD